MKFRNLTGDTLHVPSLGVYIAPGEQTPDLDEDLAAGFVGQVETWRAVGVDDRKTQDAVVAEIQAPDNEENKS